LLASTPGALLVSSEPGNGQTRKLPLSNPDELAQEPELTALGARTDSVEHYILQVDALASQHTCRSNDIPF
jgi:hypothetical protein